MPAVEPNYGSVPKPDHVRPDQVVDFDYFRPPGIEEGDVYLAWKRLHDGPDIFWTPRNGGHWVVTRAEDIKYVQQTFEIFSHEVFTIPRGASRIQMPPLTVDPPNHARYRAVLNPVFRGVKMTAMESDIRALTVELIEDLKPQGRCEFLTDFAQVMPVTVFLGLADLPLSKRRDFVEWAVTYIASSDQATRDLYLNKVMSYLGAVLEERKHGDGEDLLSKIARWSKTPDCGPGDMMGMAAVVFFGGLDTVANMLSFTARHLAEHPEHRRRLIEEPGLSAKAAEEYIRRHGLSNTGRLVKVATDYKGVHFAVDDMVMVPISMSSMDERKYDRPLEVDFDRDLEAGHDTFGNGPHRCVGAPLARLELRIFLEEWLKRIPEFRIDPAQPFSSYSAPVNGVRSLNLVWKA